MGRQFGGGRVITVITVYGTCHGTAPLIGMYGRYGWSQINQARVPLGVIYRRQGILGSRSVHLRADIVPRITGDGTVSTGGCGTAQGHFRISRKVGKAEKSGHQGEIMFFMNLPTY